MEVGERERGVREGVLDSERGVDSERDLLRRAGVLDWLRLALRDRERDGERDGSRECGDLDRECDLCLEGETAGVASWAEPPFMALRFDVDMELASRAWRS